MQILFFFANFTRPSHLRAPQLLNVVYFISCLAKCSVWCYCCTLPHTYKNCNNISIGLDECFDLDFWNWISTLEMLLIHKTTKKEWTRFCLCNCVKCAITQLKTIGVRIYVEYAKSCALRFFLYVFNFHVCLCLCLCIFNDHVLSIVLPRYSIRSVIKRYSAYIFQRI